MLNLWAIPFLLEENILTQQKLEKELFKSLPHSPCSLIKH
jgi:hypothetical protein